MGKDVLACLMRAADAYFGNISSAGSAQLLDGLESELKQAVAVQPPKGVCGGAAADIDDIMQAAQYVKKVGVYPFYITRLAAAAVYCESDEESEIADAIAIGGVRTAVEAIFDMVLEPELSLMIAQAYAKVLSGTLADIDSRKFELMKTGYEKGFDNEKTYTGCAQCTIKAFSDTVGIDSKEQAFLFRAASSMAGGIGICSDSACGAYSAGVMIIGSLVGRTLEGLGEKDNSTRRGHMLSQRIHDKFVAAYGSVNCCDLHGCKYGRAYNLRDKEDRKAFHDAGAHDVICPTTVGLATSWLIEALYDEGLIGS